MTNIEIVKKIISLHLRGKSLREIEADTNVSKDTANGIINDWRQGQIQYLQEGIPLETRMIEASRFMDKNQIDLQEALRMSNDLVILEASGVDHEQIFSLLTMLKGLKPDQLVTFTKTAITLNKNGIIYTDLEPRSRELEAKNKELEDRISFNNATLKSQEGKIQANNDQMIQQQSQIKSNAKELKEIMNNRFMDEEMLATSQRINGALEKMNVNPKEIENFITEAIEFNYSAADLQDAKLVWDALPQNINRSVAVVELKYTLDLIKDSGWDFTSSMEIARKLLNISGSKKNVLNMVTDLDLSLTNVKKEIERVKKEIKETKDENTKLSQENLKLTREHEKLVEKKKDMDAKIDRSMNTNTDYVTKSISLKLEMDKMQEAINAGKALTYILSNNSDKKVDMTFFSNPKNAINRETYKKLRSSLLNIILIEFKDEVALVEFLSREKMKIIDGDRIEAAEEIIELGKEEMKKIPEYNTIRNQYATDYEGYFTDLCEGKVKISKKLSDILRMRMDSIYKKVLNRKLSEQLSTVTNTMTTTEFPMTTIIQGIPGEVMVPYDSLTKSLKENLKNFGIIAHNNKEMITISTCDALNYFTMELCDPEFGKEMRKRYRESMEKASRSHVPEEDEQPGFKLTHIDQA